MLVPVADAKVRPFIEASLSPDLLPSFGTDCARLFVSRQQTAASLEAVPFVLVVAETGTAMSEAAASVSFAR